VADVLRALEADARTLEAQARRSAIAGDSFALAQRQFDLGAVNTLTLLDAERQAQEARLGLIKSQADRFSDSAALFQALGGGWRSGGDGEMEAGPFPASAHNGPGFRLSPE
jgi:outer membrane protein TolC